ASSSPTPDATTESPPPSEEPSPEPAETDAAPAACQAKDISVQAVADSDTYPAGALPQLSISLTNNGQAACTLDVGSATQTFTITSGDDVWWRSTDCQQNPSNMIVTLKAGQ